MTILFADLLHRLLGGPGLGRPPLNPLIERFHEIRGAPVVGVPERQQHRPGARVQEAAHQPKSSSPTTTFRPVLQPLSVTSSAGR